MTTSTNCVQLKAKLYQRSLCLMKHNRHYLNVLSHIGPCYAYALCLCFVLADDLHRNISRFGLPLQMTYITIYLDLLLDMVL